MLSSDWTELTHCLKIFGRKEGWKDGFLKVQKANFSFSFGLCVCLHVLMSEAYFGSPPYFSSQGSLLEPGTYHFG